MEYNRPALQFFSVWLIYDFDSDNVEHRGRVCRRSVVQISTWAQLS
jgi:hypothetical protein